MRRVNVRVICLSAVIALGLAIGSGLVGTPQANAKGPASRITIVGPGIDSALELVNDAALLSKLSFATLEDFQQPIEPPAHPAPGYELARYFELNTGEYVPFDVVSYHPAPNGEPGAVHYQGIVNGSSEYDGNWYRAQPESEAALREVLAANGADLDAVTAVTEPYLAIFNPQGMLRLLNATTLEPAGEWQIDGVDQALVDVKTGPEGDSLYLEALDDEGNLGTLRLDLAEGRVHLLKMPGQVVSALPGSDHVIVASWQDTLQGQGPSGQLDVRQSDTLDLTAAILVPGKHQAAEHVVSPDGRWVATLHHGDDAAWVGMFDTYWREYVTDRKLGDHPAGAMYRVAWDTASSAVYIVDGQRVHRFELGSLWFNPYGGLELVDHNATPLGEPGDVFEIAGVTDRLLYLYRQGEGGIYVVRARLGQLNERLWADLPLLHAVLHRGTLFALDKPNEAGEVTLWSLNPQTGERQRMTVLPHVKHWLSLVWLDPAALPGSDQPVVVAVSN